MRFSGAVAVLFSLVAGLSVFSSGPAAAATVNVGSFTKATGTPTATQAVAHGLGEAPKALILWTMGQTDENFAPSFHLAIGATDGTSSESAATASVDASNKSEAIRRMAFKVITIVEWGQVVLAEADLQSWDATTFTLNWTTNDAAAYVIHFIAIGGDEVSAKVKDWVQRSGSTGIQSVTGIGFKPDLVIHVHVGAGFTTAPPGSGVDASLGLGMMDKHGNQWHSQFYTVDNSGSSDTQRVQQTTVTIAGIHSDLQVKKEASYESMDADGFSVNWTTVDAAASRIFSLGLKGLSVHLGSFDKTTAPATATQSITGVGFRPRAVLLASFQDFARATPVTQSRFGFGASNLTAQGSSACHDADALGLTSVDGIDKTGRTFVKVDNDTPGVDAEASLASLDDDGFSLTWPINDAVATQILYLALGNGRRVFTFARNRELGSGPGPEPAEARRRAAAVSLAATLAERRQPKRSSPSPSPNLPFVPCR